VKHDLMNLRKLRHVVALASHGSYVAAARELNLGPSALSRSIQSLEEEMNLVLFTRGKGGVFATPAGTRVINAANGLIENLTQLQESLGNLAHGELGETAIGVAPLPAAIVLAPLFERTLEERKLRIQVQVEAGARLLELLNSGRIEFFVGTAGSIGRAPNITIAARRHFYCSTGSKRSPPGAKGWHHPDGVRQLPAGRRQFRGECPARRAAASTL
jgi:DNA-binding transcriptional LysR family regulator